MRAHLEGCPACREDHESLRELVAAATARAAQRVRPGRGTSPTPHDHPHHTPRRGERLRRDPVAQATLLLRIGFTVAPILFGLDKFANVLTDDWTRYLAPAFNDIIPGSAEDAMYIVGVIEIVAGLVVAVAPRFGGLLVAAWLGGIIVNLLIVGGYGDIALRDFGSCSARSRWPAWRVTRRHHRRLTHWAAACVQVP